MTHEVRADLLAVVSRIRRRWRLRVALQGLALALGALVLWTLVGAGVLDLLHFSPLAIGGFRVVGLAGLAAAAAWLVLRPAVRRVSDQQIALYIEEQEPDLHALLLSAVEHGTPGAGASPALAERVVRDAVARMRAVDGGLRIDRPRILKAGVGSLAIAGFMTLATLMGPGWFRETANLLMPWREAAAATPYAVLVEPGNATVAKGGDQEIRATLRGFSSDRVELLFRMGDEPEWQRVTMAPGDTGAVHVFRLFDVTRPIQYVVEAGGVRSGQFTLSVADLPAVGTYAVELRYPSHTGLGRERLEPAGDIVAPRGTSARFEVTPTIPAPAGRLVLDVGDTIPLRPDSAGILVGESRLTRSATYRIELQAREGHFVEASLRYHIDLLDDRGPTVLIRKPGRDAQATSVEEFYLEAEASDDFGIRLLELVYRVNGGEERVVRLHDGSGRRLSEVSAGHTLFLEEFGLEPGDVIAYYARATDNSAPGKAAASDIYFLKIRPFGKEYRQAEQQGMPGQSGDSPQDLSEQQKQIVAATFKLVRDSATAPADRRREDLATLALAQGRLRERVSGLVAQLIARGAASVDSHFAVIQRELEQAVPEMQAAEEQLGRRAADRALAPEQRALQHLQRAEEVFREVQIAMGGQQGGQNGQQPSNAEDLADLFELETDKLRNQYETLERSREQQTRQEMDETLERLRQLASRQQQENERMRRAAEQLQNRAGQAGGGNQRQLAQETEELARRLERLTREQPSPELTESARRMREAAEAMRRSAAGQGGGEAQGQSAAERLQEAARTLERSRQAGRERATDQAARRAEELADREREIGRDTERALQGGRPSPETARALGERKDSLAAEVGRLEDELERLAREIRPEQPEAGRRIAEAAQGLREDRVEDKIRFSKGLLRGASPEYARNFEEAIAANLDSAAARIRDAGQRLGARSERREDRALDQARRLVRGLESLEERMRAAQEGGQRRAGPERGGQPPEGGQQAGGGQQAEGGQGRTRADEGGQNRQGTPEGGGVPPEGEMTGGGRPGLPDASRARQFSRELRERRMGADSLRAEVDRMGLDPSDLDRIIAELRRLESTDVFSDPTALERLEQAVLDRMKAFEFALRRQLEGEPTNRPVVGAGDRVPPKFRELVEEYYRSLARERRR